MVIFTKFLTALALLLCCGRHAAGQNNCIKESDPFGWQYRGKIAETKDGIPCQSWTSDELHKRKYLPKNPSEHSNYCRTTTNSRPGGPWCYTTVESPSWDYCDVSKCSECLQDDDPSGQKYVGTVSHTKTGRLCQRWDANTPHNPHHQPDNPSSHENYCRNLDDEPHPWCYTVDPNKRWEYCSVRKCSEPKAPESCYFCNGEFYRGKLNVTTSGKTCQKWTDVTPHQHYSAIFFPHLAESENYCRNVRNWNGVWCYTTDPNTKWEYCDLDRCLNEDGSINVPPAEKLYPEVQTSCYSGTGRSYRGNVSTTLSGGECRDWSWARGDQTHPCSGLQKNYCRNAYNSKRHRPWCMPAAFGSPSWEFCDIPNCDFPNVEEPPLEYSQRKNLEWVMSKYPQDPKGCYSCNGNTYRGNVSTTVSGRTCQRWDSNSPHSHKNFEHFDMVENYCRSADNEPKPWCYTTDSDKRWEYCDIERCMNSDGSVYMPDWKYTTECAFIRGESYRGNASQTMSGRTCADWGSNLNHQHDFTPEKYPCSGLDENYCRKPEAYFQTDAPWCYTTDPNKKWEYCDVPHCDSDGNPHTVENQRADECGVQVIQPVFTSQPYAIVDGALVKTEEESASYTVEKIIGGEHVAQGTWPWLITLQNDNAYHLCGATLIAKSWVLTAAHCLTDQVPTQYVAIAGFDKKRLTSGGQGRAIKRHFFHKEYIYGSRNDIALLQLDSPFEYTDYVQPICLPEPEEFLPYGTNCVAAGWGSTHDPNGTGALKQVVLPTYDCDSALYICTGKYGVDENICPGDSGGPYMCLQKGRWVQHGIAAYHHGCGDKRGRAGWVRLSKFIGWINKIIEEYDQK